jgi:hypothetical protein
MAKTFIASKSWLRRLAETLCVIKTNSHEIRTIYYHLPIHPKLSVF